MRKEMLCWLCSQTTEVGLSPEEIHMLHNVSHLLMICCLLFQSGRAVWVSFRIVIGYGYLHCEHSLPKTFIQAGGCKGKGWSLLQKSVPQFSSSRASGLHETLLELLRTALETQGADWKASQFEFMGQDGNSPLCCTGNWSPFLLSRIWDSRIKKTEKAVIHTRGLKFQPLWPGRQSDYMPSQLKKKGVTTMAH